MSKNIALIAHDNKKKELLLWAEVHAESIRNFTTVYATGTTGRMLEEKLSCSVHKLNSGPLGGDQQIGALISEGKVDVLIFFWDPLEPLPHDQDIKALLRLATVWNIPIACNKSTADILFASPMLWGDYQRVIPNFSGYENRKL